jgi:hypothetical protein
MTDSRRTAITASPVAQYLADGRADLLRLAFRLPMRTWPKQLRPELRAMLAAKRLKWRAGAGQPIP